MTVSTPCPFRSQMASGLNGETVVPGDKSISHRALMLSSQISGITRISGLLEGEDVLNTANAMRFLGVDLRRLGNGQWEVHGKGIGSLTESTHVLDMGNSGTSTRLLMGLVAPYPFTTFFAGDESLSKRPMGRVMIPLREMGARITARDGHFLPLVVVGTDSPIPITYILPVASAQVKSALLLAALNTHGKTTVIEKRHTRDHTENMLKYFGFHVQTEILPEGKISISIVGKQNVTPANHEITIPGDPSSAAFLMVAAIICKHSNLIIKNVCVNPLRTGLLITLKEMGANIVLHNERIVAGERVADIQVASSVLNAVIVSEERAPSMIDEYPILAVAAAFAEGETVMHGLSELRVKESDRLAAIVSGLCACGVNAYANGDDLHVIGARSVKGGATIATHYDHRIAMAFLVMGIASQEAVCVDDVRAIATSFPNFIELFNALGAKISGSILPPTGKKIVIAIDGPAASGKGTLARRLAEHFGLDYLDTGGLYRAVGLKLIYSGKDPNDLEAALEAARSIDDGDLANPRLRQERIGQAASIVSAFPEVRQALLDFQRNFSRSKKGAVLDGRDIGTVVCPDADLKFFLTATLYARAKRRHKELQGEGIEVVFESVLEDLRERDARDEKRTVAPLKPASDAIIMDTSILDANSVFEKSCDMVRSKL